MRITGIRAATVPLNIEMSNAAFSFRGMSTTIVAVLTDRVAEGRPVTGFAFNSTGRYACTATIEGRIAPRLMDAEPGDLLDPATGLVDPARAAAVMATGEKPGGDLERSMAIGTVEVALWDAVAKVRGQPLHHLLADAYGRPPPPDRMFCYVGGGWYRDGQTPADLCAEMDRYLDAGYRLVKTKVGGRPLDEDRRRVDALLAHLDGRAGLAVDANGALSPDRARTYAEAFRGLGLRWFEEPVHPLDYAATAEFGALYGDPVATGENLFSRQDLMNLQRFGGLRPHRDLIQTDVPQSYGYDATARAVRMLEAEGWSAASILPHGGNQMSLAAALGLGMGMCESYPDVFGVFSGYADGAALIDGCLPAPTAPGIGFERQARLYGLFRDLAN